MTDDSTRVYRTGQLLCSVNEFPSSVSKNNNKL